MIPLDMLLTFYRHLPRGIMGRSEIAPRCIATTNVLYESPHDIFKIASKYTFFAMVTGKRPRSIAKYFSARPDLTLPEKRSRGEYNSLRLNPFRLDMLNDFILLFPYAKWLYSCSVKSVMFSWYAEYANDNYE